MDVSIEGRILTNLFSLTTARVAVRAFAAIAIVIIARHLGVEEFGVYASAFSFASFAAIFTDVGSAQVVLRSASRRAGDLDRTFGNAILIKCTLAVVAYVGVVFVSRTLGHSENLHAAILILSVALFLQSAQQLPISVFQGFERMHLTAAFQAGSGLVSLLGVLVVAFLGWGLYEIAGVQVVAALVWLPFMAVAAFRLVRPKLAFSEVRELVRSGLSFAITSILFLVNQQAPVLLLTSLAEPTSVGLFSAAYRPVAMLYFIPSIVSSVLIPILFRYGANDRDRHQDMSRRLLRYLSLSGLILSSLLFLSSGPLVDLLYGKEYMGSAPLLRNLCWFLALQCLSYPLGDMLTTSDRNDLRVIVFLAASLVSIGGGYFAIRHFGAHGATYSTLAAEGMLVLGGLFFVKRTLSAFPLFRSLIAQAASTLLGLTAAVFLLGAKTASDLWEASLASAVFLAVTSLFLVLFRFFDEDEKRVLRRLWPGVRA